MDLLLLIWITGILINTALCSSHEKYLYLGCYGNVFQGCKLTGSFSDINVEDCDSKCTGYTYMAIFKGTSCYCCNDSNFSVSSKTTATLCNKACPTDTTSLCGGIPSYTSVYSRREPTNVYTTTTNIMELVSTKIEIQTTTILPSPITTTHIVPCLIATQTDGVSCPSAIQTQCLPCPSATDVLCPSATDVPCPSATHDPCPLVTQTGTDVVPAPSAIDALCPSATCVPCPSAIDALCPSATCVPCPSAIDALCPSATCVPCPSAIDALCPSAIDALFPSATCLPCPSATQFQINPTPITDIFVSSMVLNLNVSKQIVSANNVEVPSILKSQACQYVIVVTDFSAQSSEAASSIAERLIVPKNNISAFKASKNSTPDDRISAQAIGYSGILLFVVPFTLIVWFDLISILKLRQRVKRSNSRKKTSRKVHRIIVQTNSNCSVEDN